MTTIQVENLTGVLNANSTDILGNVVWYNISKQEITPKDLKEKLLAAGIDERWMPNPIRYVDAYRRATNIKKKRETDVSGVYVNYLCREVCADDDIAIRHIVAEKVDQSGKTLEYNAEAGKLILNKKEGTLTVEHSDQFVEVLCLQALDNFEKYKNHYQEQQIRVMVARILSSMAPTPLRANGGVYFVPQNYSEQLLKFVQFVSSLNESNGWKLPVVDTFDNRTMVTHTLKEHIETVYLDCKAGIGVGLKKSKVQELIEKAKKINNDYKSYNQLLVDGERNDVEAKLEEIRKMMVQLLAEISA